MNTRIARACSLILIGLVGLAAHADVVRVSTKPLETGSQATLVQLAPDAPVTLPADWESRVLWDVRSLGNVGQTIRNEIVDPQEAGLMTAADWIGADRALCSYEVAGGRRLGCSLFRSADSGPAGLRTLWSDLPGALRGIREVHSSLEPGSVLEVGNAYAEIVNVDGKARQWVSGRAVGEGVVLTYAGPREVVMLREDVLGHEGRRTRYRFLDGSGIDVAQVEGRWSDNAFALDRAEVLGGVAGPLADDGITIPYKQFRGRKLGQVQYATDGNVELSVMDPAWLTVQDMISIDQTAVDYQPDFEDPTTLQTLPEVWDLTTLSPAGFPAPLVATLRDELAWSGCLESCALRDVSATPPDGTWQTYLKFDRYLSTGTFQTRDVFTFTDNDTGADPSIDTPYIVYDQENATSSQTQVCFEDSAGGPERFLRFFQFTGPDPASAVMSVGDTWTSGAWTECDNANGLRVTEANICGGAACYPECSLVNPRARGMLGDGAGFFNEVVEDGWARVPQGNYLPVVLLRQDNDLEAGVDLFGICNVAPERLRTFIYFWIHEDYGLLGQVNALPDTTGNMPPDDWTLVNNSANASFAWGPFPPHQFSAQSCLNGVAVTWELPEDGSNLTGTPGVTDYGYVVSWGAQTDPEELADWDNNPNHTPLPGEPGYLLATPGSEPTFAVINGWPGSTINATVTRAFSYTDPDIGDTLTYQSSAFFKSTQDTTAIDPGGFFIGDVVDPFVDKAGSDLLLSWPSVAGAGWYELTVWDLDTDSVIPCPAGLDCEPRTNSVTHEGGIAAGSYGYRVLAVDPCGEASPN
ncbi:MAG: hypothetical protein GY716_16550 [bacterium]|nr:hypothetical protein [bacterium]